MMKPAERVCIKPFKFKDTLTKNTIRFEVSPDYFKLLVNDRVYYFDKETGDFDGVSRPMKNKREA